MSNPCRVLLIDPSGWQKGVINVGLAYLASSLKKAGHLSHILDLNSRSVTDPVLIKRVKAFNPSVIGLSVKTATATEAGRLATLLTREFPTARLICGGPHVTLCATRYLTVFPAFHYGIMGEAEESLVALATALASGNSVESIPGVVHRTGNSIRINPWSPPGNLDALPLPDLDEIEGFSWHQLRYPLVTSRGCPFDCIYCCVNKLTGSKHWRKRNVENVVDELEHLARTKGVTRFEILDDNFTLQLDRAKAICRELIRRRLKLSWYCHNGIRADRIDRELARLMKRAGCTSIAFGIESGNPATFESIKKGEPLSAVVNAVKLVKQAGIKAVGYFIIGLPGDTLDRFIETVRFQRQLKLHDHVYGMLIPYPETEVWDLVQQHGQMLCDITETRHFHPDLVPISFELPEFPRQEMVRAYYIARFFDLFETVQQVIKQGKTPIVVYQDSPSLRDSLAGLILACDSEAEHIVLGQMDSFSRSPSFSQIPPQAHLLFSNTAPSLRDNARMFF